MLAFTIVKGTWQNWSDSREYFQHIPRKFKLHFFFSLLISMEISSSTSTAPGPPILFTTFKTMGSVATVSLNSSLVSLNNSLVRCNSSPVRLNSSLVRLNCSLASLNSSQVILNSSLVSLNSSLVSLNSSLVSLNSSLVSLNSILLSLSSSLVSLNNTVSLNSSLGDNSTATASINITEKSERLGRRVPKRVTTLGALGWVCTGEVIDN